MEIERALPGSGACPPCQVFQQEAGIVHTQLKVTGVTFPRAGVQAPPTLGSPGQLAGAITRWLLPQSSFS